MQYDMGTVIKVTLMGALTPPAEFKKKTTLQAKFGDFGQILRLEIPEEQAIAYIQYEDKRDAEDAIVELNGSKMCGHQLRVEIATGRDAAGGAGGFRKVDIEKRVDEMTRKYHLDDLAATGLLSVFKERVRLRCDLERDFEELQQHLLASNKPSASVCNRLADLRAGKPIGPCKFQAVPNTSLTVEAMSFLTLKSAAPAAKPGQGANPKKETPPHSNAAKADRSHDANDKPKVSGRSKSRSRGRRRSRSNRGKSSSCPCERDRKASRNRSASRGRSRDKVRKGIRSRTRKERDKKSVSQSSSRRLRRDREKSRNRSRSKVHHKKSASQSSSRKHSQDKEQEQSWSRSRSKARHKKSASQSSSSKHSRDREKSRSRSRSKARHKKSALQSSSRKRSRDKKKKGRSRSQERDKKSSSRGGSKKQSRTKKKKSRSKKPKR